MQEEFMSGYDKPIAGPRKFCRAKSCSSVGAPGDPSLDRIKICCEGKNGPPPAGLASPKSCSSVGPPGESPPR